MGGVDSRTAPDRTAVATATAAAALGFASAGISAYWALGGTALLDTVGGDIERWGRERGTAVVAALWTVVAIKVVVALAAPVLVGVVANRLPAWTRSVVLRALGWTTVMLLTAYGAVLTIAGVLIEAGAIDADATADDRALAWHTYLWDPWFALWGATFLVALWRTRRTELSGRRS